MSAYAPPTYYFSNILFNSAFYNPSTSALTQSQASALYLLKNTADTATALESFTGGILTNNIDSNSTLNLGTGASTFATTIGKTGFSTNLNGDTTVNNHLSLTYLPSEIT